MRVSPEVFSAIVDIVRPLIRNSGLGEALEIVSNSPPGAEESAADYQQRIKVAILELQTEED